MNFIKPKPLKSGDTIAIIAPCGSVDRDKLAFACKYFESKNFNIVLGKNIFEQKRYMAGSDFQRLDDLHAAFANKEVDAIFCARGGYGALRLFPYIDFELIKNNPKIFCGYSDVTALSLMFFAYSNLITYSAPMPQSDFSGEINEFTEKSLFRVLSGEYERYEHSNIVLPGIAEGITWGGNLSTIVSLLGADNLKNRSCSSLDIIPDDKFIFFVEDVTEPVYKIDKMLMQLANIKKFKNNISGIAFGEFTGVDNEDWLQDVLLEFAVNVNVPAYSGFKFTHGNAKQTIPIGVQAKLSNVGLTVI